MTHFIAMEYVHWAASDGQSICMTQELDEESNLILGKAVSGSSRIENSFLRSSAPTRISSAGVLFVIV
jgi:hypothetical protein